MAHKHQQSAMVWRQGDEDKEAAEGESLPDPWLRRVTGGLVKVEAQGS